MLDTTLSPPPSSVQSRRTFRTWLPWLILGLLVVSRVALVLSTEPIPGDDGDRYMREAVSLWTHGVYSDHINDTLPSAHDLPLYPLLLAALVALVKTPLLAAKLASLVNCALFGVAARAVFLLAMRLTADGQVAALAMVIFGCFPGAYPYSAFYMPESLFIVLFLRSLLMFEQFLRTEQPSHLWGAFALWGLSILAKPISIAFGFVLAAMAIVAAVKRRQNIAQRVRVVLVGLALGYALLAPWMIRNHTVFGVFGFSSITGTNPFYCNYLFMLEDMGVPNAHAALSVKEAEIFAALPPALNNPMGRARALGTFAEGEILRNLPHYLRTVAKRHPALYTSTGAVDTLRLFGDDQGIAAMEQGLADRSTLRQAPVRVLALLAESWAFLALVYGAAAYGLVKLVRRRAWTAAGMLLSVLVYFAVVIGPVTSARYRFVMVPAFAIAAAVGLRRDWGVAKSL